MSRLTWAVLAVALAIMGFMIFRSRLHQSGPRQVDPHAGQEIKKARQR